MSLLEVAMWSAATGAIALVVLICLVDLALLRTPGTVQAAVYNVAVLGFVFFMSGLPRQLAPGLPPAWVEMAQVIAGPVCSVLADFWVRGWLATRHRDRVMDMALLAAGFSVPVATVACMLWLPPSQQLGAAGIISVLDIVVVLWVCVRAWLLGDRLALGVAVGCAVMLPAAAGLYAVALQVPGLGVGWQAGTALASVLCMAIISSMLWKRNQHERRLRGVESAPSQFDVVTKLPGGIPLVRELMRAQERRRITRREGALLAVILYAPDKLTAVIGASGLNEVYLQLARRLQRQVGVVNPVGRYWDRCFVALVETVHSPAALRTLGLRVASTLRRPLHVTSADGRQVEVRMDIGVGVLHLGREPAEVEDLLHDAQNLAEAARHMDSRAATHDPRSGAVVPVERAHLGPRRPRPRVRAAAGGRQRAPA